MKQDRKTVLIAGLIGNVVEWYDFALYGFFATVFSKIFFPESSGFANLLAVYGIFAAGFLMRPIGSVLFGWMGDRVGRSHTMMVSVALMALPTLLLGFLPDYQQIGLAAPIILVCLRLLQGLSVGGEFSTSVVYLVETAPADRRGRSGSLANLGSIAGTALGSLLAMAVLNLLPEQDAYSWGWRIPYFIGGIIGVAALVLRQHLPRSPAFERQEKMQEESAPLMETLTTTASQTVKATIFAAGYGVLFYLGSVYFPNWLANHGQVDLDTAMWLNTIALVVILPLVFFSGWLSDRFVPRKWLVAGALLTGAFAGWGAMSLALDGGVFLAGICQLFLAVILAFLLGAAPALFAEIFPARNRNTGYSISYAIGMGIMGGATPMIATWLIELSGSSLAPAYLIVAAGIISAIAVISMTGKLSLELSRRHEQEQAQN